jgi:hypothetical protein
MFVRVQVTPEVVDWKRGHTHFQRHNNPIRTELSQIVRIQPNRPMDGWKTKQSKFLGQKFLMNLMSVVFFFRFLKADYMTSTFSDFIENEYPLTYQVFIPIISTKLMNCLGVHKQKL